MTVKFLATLLAAAVLAPAAAQAQHDHATHAAVADVPPPAEPWPADATLDADMAQVHTVLEQLRHYEMGHMDATLALDRVDVLQSAVADIFAKCALGPERDAVLHRMLVPLLAAAQKFRADPQDMAPLAAMRAAVADYPRYFDAPGWTALAHMPHAMHDLPQG